MGAGKGKTRRSKTALSTGLVAVFDESRWAEFAENSELRNVGIYEYYLGARPAEITHVDHERIATELFKDAVAIGSLVLPEGYDPEDFEFVMDPSYQFPISVGLKGKPETQTSLKFNPFYWLEKSSTASFATVNKAI